MLPGTNSRNCVVLNFDTITRPNVDRNARDTQSSGHGEVVLFEVSRDTDIQ